MAGIIYSDYYIPDNVVNVLDVLKKSSRREVQNDKYLQYFIDHSKLKEICIEEEKDKFQILEILIERFFSKSNIKPKDIDYVIYTSYPYKFTDGNVCIPYALHKHFSLSSATVIGMFQECATTLQGLKLAQTLIDSGTIKNVMIISICYGLNMHERFDGFTVVGDGAGIVVVGNENIESEIVAHRSISNGYYSYNQYKGISENIGNLEVVKVGCKLIHDIVNQNGIRIDDLKKLILQNINFFGYEAYSELLGVKISCLYSKNLSNGGHMADVDVIRNYTDANKEGLLTKDDLFLLYAAGNIEHGMDIICNTVLLRRF